MKGVHDWILSQIEADRHINMFDLVLLTCCKYEKHLPSSNWSGMKGRNESHICRHEGYKNNQRFYRPRYRLMLESFSTSLG